MQAKRKSKLRDARLKAQLSQNQLARRAGIDRKTIGDIENFKTKPQDLTLAKLANALSAKLRENVTIESISE